VSWLDRAKEKLGFGSRTDQGAEPSERPAKPPSTKAAGTKGKAGRPALPESVSSPGATLEDALAARAAGHAPEARAILAAIDKGQGLRTVLRAAAALEAGDTEELARLLPGVAGEQPSWHLPLQVAMALEPGARRDALARRAKDSGAPAWALAWVRAVSTEENERREGLVDLLFDDPPLARTVAARDLEIPAVRADNDAVRRYASFAHGRDSIRRFGAAVVADLLERTPQAATRS
jgi:hypothetical protein